MTDLTVPPSGFGLYSPDLGVGAVGLAAAARRCTSLTKVDLACNRLSPAVGRQVLATLQGVAASRAGFTLELRQLAVHGAGRMSGWEFLSKRRTRLYFGTQEGAAMSRSERERWDELVPELDPDYEPQQASPRPSRAHAGSCARIASDAVIAGPRRDELKLLQM